MRDLSPEELNHEPLRPFGATAKKSSARYLVLTK